jgi:hypothetical protein
MMDDDPYIADFVYNERTKRRKIKSLVDKHIHSITTDDEHEFAGNPLEETVFNAADFDGNVIGCSSNNESVGPVASNKDISITLTHSECEDNG